MMENKLPNLKEIHDNALSEYQEKNMKVKPPSLKRIKGKNYYLVTEESIKLNLENFKDHSDASALSDSLIDGNAIRRAGLNPIYIYNEVDNDITITSREYYNNELH